MNVNSKFLTMAAQEALKGIFRGEGGPFGAVIVYQGTILARSHNTVLKSNDPTQHAEINAIRVATKKIRRFVLTDCIVYSTTEPCPMCFSAIHWAQARAIVYSSTISEVKKLGFNELSISNRELKKRGKSPVIIRQLKNLSCHNLLGTWKKLENRRTY